ncbi:MAG TPA: PAS domain S-box protein [Solirubrobacteraceae bacterium]|nr:PAS domain S-box protein [Solirubrobacteraceae bacterium]
MEPLADSAARGPEDDAARAAEARLASALAAQLELALDAIFARDARRRITFWNKGAQETYGYSAREALGRRPQDLLLTEYPLELEQIEQLVAERGGWEGELVQHAKDGRRLVVESRWAAQYDERGRLAGLLEVNREVTNRLADQAAMLECAPDAFVGVGGDGLIMLVNAQAEALFGYARDELIGRSLATLVPERFRERHETHRTAYFEDPRPRPMGEGRLHALRRDGSEFPAEICLSSVQTADGAVALAAIRDVSERLVAEQERERLRAQAEREKLRGQLEQTHRLESLGQLAGGIAHDFNNLLAVIINYAAFVADELQGASRVDGEARWQGTRHDLQQVRLAAERAAQLTHQLLAFARREVVQPEVIDVNEVVGDVEQLLRRTLGEHIELTSALQEGLLPVLMDPGKLEQILVNLAVNARDAMPDGGVLRIDTANVQLDEEYVSARPELSAGAHVRIRVSDTGAGMSQEVLERAFDPFFTTKPQGEGTGLGLATVYGIIKQAGGRAQIYSEEGVGTTFTALLPASERSQEHADEARAQAGEAGAGRAQAGGAPAQAGEAGAAPRAEGGETILLVEDELALRAVARRILTRAGYRVIAVASGAEAVALAATELDEIDLLLTDVIMPQMQGPQLAERLREVRPELRVLFMSGFAQPILDSRGTLGRGVLLLEKPFSAPMLLERVNEAFGR